MGAARSPSSHGRQVDALGRSGVALLACWTAALGWSGWWTWQLWASSGLYAVGPAVAYLFWLARVLPLFGATAVWRGRRMPGRRLWPAYVAVGATVLFVAFPFRLPRVHFDGQRSRTEGSWLLYVHLAALTVLPASLAASTLWLVLRRPRPLHRRPPVEV